MSEREKFNIVATVIGMRLCQVMVYCLVALVFYLVWYFCTDSDVLYLAGWWLIIGNTLGFLLAMPIDDGIKAYKRQAARRIRKYNENSTN